MKRDELAYQCVHYDEGDEAPRAPCPSGKRVSTRMAREVVFDIWDSRTERSPRCASAPAEKESHTPRSVHL